MHDKQTITVSLNQFDKVKWFINMVNDYNCQIDVSQGKYTVDGHSILGIYSLNLINPVNVTIYGDDEKTHKLAKEIEEEFGI